MHPPLSLHLHPRCKDVILALHKCHTNHKIGKFFGKCNDHKRALDDCLTMEVCFCYTLSVFNLPSPLQYLELMEERKTKGVPVKITRRVNSNHQMARTAHPDTHTHTHTENHQILCPHFLLHFPYIFLLLACGSYCASICKRTQIRVQRGERNKGRKKKQRKEICLVSCSLSLCVCVCVCVCCVVLCSCAFFMCMYVCVIVGLQVCTCIIVAFFTGLYLGSANCYIFRQPNNLLQQ